jgi:histidinol dehydrogenase
VEGIVADVRARGDVALLEYTARFDGFRAAAVADLAITPAELERGERAVDPAVRAALAYAAERIERYHAAALPKSWRLTDEHGSILGQEVRPLERVGVYIPGGRAAYPSSVLMCAIPARVAGVVRVAVTSPPGAAGRPNAAILAACSIAGVDEVYAAGGAQAIAAFGLGTESIKRVDLVAGPGNRYVQEAKRAVSASVGIDGIAGPTELMVVADGIANPDWIALDVCAQGEHGDDSLLIVASPDVPLLQRIAELVERLVADRPTVADAALALVATSGVEAALTLADAVAPEHLELSFEGADVIAARGRVAGCVFVGAGGATAFGDYAVGSNHVLPTGGAARFGGPLGPGAFRRRTSVVTLERAPATALAPYVGVLARAEGLPVHGESAEARAGS